MTFDQTRRACYAGYVTQAIVNNLAPLLFIVFQNRYSISYEMLGRLILLNFATQLLTDCVTIKVMNHTNYRAPMVLAHLLCVIGLVLLALLPLVMQPYWGLCVAVVVYAIGGGLLEVLVSPIVEALPTPQQGKAAAMSLLHSFYCWGQVAVVLITTLLLAQIGQGAWPILPVVWAIVPLVNLFFFLRVPLPETVPSEHRTSFRELFTSPAFCASIILMMCAGASELTMSQWSSLFAEQGLRLPKIWGDLAGPCLFAVLMGLGRILYGLWGERISLFCALCCCGILATACYLAAALSASPLFSLIGCALCGLAVSLLWPGTYSFAAARFPLGGAAMFGVLALFGDLGAGVGPWLTGVVADVAPQEIQAGAERNIFSALLTYTQGSGLRVGLLVGTIFPLGVIGTTLGYRLWSGRQGA